MNTIQRAFIGIKRKPTKSMILLLLIFIFSNLIIGAFSIRQAVRRTEENLLSGIPAVATIGINDEEMFNYRRLTGNPASMENVTIEVISEIGNLPYVAFFDATVEEQIFSRYLSRTERLSFDPVLMDTSFLFMMEQMIVSEAGGIMRRDEIEAFRVRGVSTPNFVHQEAGVISVSEGESFTDEQIKNSEPVVLVSRQLAIDNNLQIGSVLPLESNFYYGWGPFVDENIMKSRNLELTVIGIFDLNLDFFDYEGLEPEVAGIEEIRMINLLYVPFGIAESAARLVFESWREIDEWIDDAAIFEDYQNIRPLFYLHDSRMLPDFALAAQEHLPEFWEIQNLSQTFGNLTNAMKNLLWIFDWVFYIAVLSMCVVTALLVTLFLRDRKEEIGIYLALGASRIKIINQILLEVVSVAMVALFLASISGNFLSNQLSRQLLETELIQQREEMLRLEGWYYGIVPFDLTVFHSEMTTEEMLIAFDTSMSPIQFLTFYGIALGVVLVSTLLPIIYTIRLNPKKILM